MTELAKCLLPKSKDPTLYPRAHMWNWHSGRTASVTQGTTLGSWRQEELEGLLASQSGQNGKLQIHWALVSKYKVEGQHMVQWVKELVVQAWPPEFDPQSPCKGRRTTTLSPDLQTCSVTHTHHTPAHIWCIQIILKISNKVESNRGTDPQPHSLRSAYMHAPCTQKESQAKENPKAYKSLTLSHWSYKFFKSSNNNSSSLRLFLSTSPGSTYHSIYLGKFSRWRILEAKPRVWLLMAILSKAHLSWHVFWKQLTPAEGKQP